MTDYAFVHGAWQGGWVWDETIDALAAQSAPGTIRALALDLPGCGAKRGQDIEALTPRDAAADLVAGIEAAGMRNVVLVGHSNAGTLIPLMAAMRPALFRRIVHVSCVALPTGTAIEPPMGTGGPGAAAQVLDGLAAVFCNDMAPAARSAFRARLGLDAWPGARALAEPAGDYDHLAALPSTYVICLRDAALVPERQEAFAERLRAGRVVRIDAGHQAMNTRPHALAEILRHEAAA